MSLLSKIEDRTAEVCVVGLGYVGLPMVMALVRAGFRVHGVDKDQNKVQAFLRGDCYLEHVDQGAVKECVDTGRAWAHASLGSIPPCDVFLVCVPTPVTRDYDPDLRAVDGAMRELAGVVTPGSLVVLESTVAPGTTQERAMWFEPGVMVAFSPEREDPGNEHYWTQNTPKLVGGVDDLSLVAACELYGAVCDQVVPVQSPEVAEMAKLFENTFRMVNVSLVNEMKHACQHMGLDPWDVIKAADTKPFGFKAFWPGPGIGGHCFVPGTLVLTENGPCPIEEIRVGDRVLSGDGKLHRVLKTFSREYNGNVVWIKSRGVLPVEATVTHEIYSARDGRPPRQGRLHFPVAGKRTIDLMKPVKKIQAGDLVAKSNYTVWPRIKDHTHKPPKHATDEYLALAGWYLSKGNLVLAKNKDGSIKSGRVQISLNAEAEDDVEQVRKLLPVVVKQVHPESITENRASLGIQERGTCTVFRHGCTPLTMMLLEDFNQRAMTKRLPAWLLWGDKRRLPIVLRGMFRGDGHFQKSVAELSYSTISPHLAFGVAVMLNRLGIKYTIHVSKLSNREHVAYSVNIANGPDAKMLSMLIDFPLKVPPGDGIEQQPANDKFIYHRVEQLKRRPYRGKVYNLHVADTNNYVTPVGVVSNCLPCDPHYYRDKAATNGVETRIVNAAFDVTREAPGWVADAVTSLQDVSRVLVIGAAYKRDVGDVRESPALEVVRQLVEQGCIVAVHDPYVADLGKLVAGLGVEAAHELNAEVVKAADVVLVLTDHRKRVPWSLVLDHAKLVVDARGFLDKHRANVIRV